DRRDDPINERRQQKLDRVSDGDPGNESDGRKLCSLVAQPIAEGVAGQKEWQAGRKPQRQHHEHAWLEVSPNSHVARVGWTHSAATQTLSGTSLAIMESSSAGP